MKAETVWSVYMIEAENGSIYTGITKDLERRFLEHTSSDKSAKFFRSSPAKEMVFSKKGFTYSEALIEEARIKKLTKEKKLEFVENSKLKKIKKSQRLKEKTK